MPANIFKYVFLVGLIAAEVIRFPHRMRIKRQMREKKFKEERVTTPETLLDFLAFTGMEVIPLVYIFAPWLNFANTSLPAWAGWLGAPVFAAALGVLWKSHADLAKNWSPTLQIMEEHKLVTEGIYGVIRHPIYAAVWLMCIAQALLLHNWIAGLAGLATFLPVYVIRVPREERMMIDHFGDEYREYMKKTGGIIPRLSKSQG